MPPQEHARLGGSKAKRWINCPGSVLLEDEFPDSSSPYAREGSAAHEVAEMCLTNGTNPEDYLGDMIPVPYEESGESYVDEIEVTQEMVDAVNLYVTTIRGLVGHHAELFIEQRFDLNVLDPPDPMYGTADAVVWHPEERRLEVNDLKYGKGVVVEAEDNDQLHMYALGAVVELRKKPEQIVFRIVQPRAYHPDGPVREATITAQELLAWKERAWASAEEAINGESPELQVGPWCRFCKAQAVCPAQKEHTAVIAQDVFEVDVPEEKGQDSPLPVPTQLTKDELVAILDRKDMIEDFLRAVHDHVHEQLRLGEEFEGYKLVEGRSRRRWRDDEEAEEYLRGHGLRKAERTKTKVISPYQAEKALKSKGVDLGRLRKLDKMIEKPEGKPKLVSADHPKPALPPVAEEAFEADASLGE